MIVALSYSAKAKGVRWGMSLKEAKEICKEFRYTHVKTFKVD